LCPTRSEVSDMSVMMVFRVMLRRHAFEVTTSRTGEAQRGLSSRREQADRRPACPARLTGDAQIQLPKIGVGVILAPSTTTKHSTIGQTRHTPVGTHEGCHDCVSVVETHGATSSLAR
jgi:hypothetical protein